MPHRANVLLPFMPPTQKLLRAAIALIIREIQRDFDETDQCTADRLGVSIGTVRNARNETADLNALTIARIGAVYGAGAIAPYNALYGATAHVFAATDAAPLGALSEALTALLGATGPKARFDTIPALREAYEKLGGYLMSLEQARLRLVA